VILTILTSLTQILNTESGAFVNDQFDRLPRKVYFIGMSIRLLAYISLLAFITLAVFGFAAMLSDMGENQGNCLASIANNGCPMPASGPAMAAFHVSAYQAFSSATVSFAVLLLIVLAAFVGSFVGFYLQKSRWKLIERLARQFTNFDSIILSLRRWLSRQEKRDPAPAF